MTTKLKLLPVRVSPALRALIDQVGPVNAATRALIILGAEAAGLDLAGMEREVAGLLAEDVASEVLRRLRHILLQYEDTENAKALSMPETIPILSSSTGSVTDSPIADLFTSIGIDV